MSSFLELWMNENDSIFQKFKSYIHTGSDERKTSKKRSRHINNRSNELAKQTLESRNISYRLYIPIFSMENFSQILYQLSDQSDQGFRMSLAGGVGEKALTYHNLSLQEQSFLCLLSATHKNVREEANLSPANC